VAVDDVVCSPLKDTCSISFLHRPDTSIHFSARLIVLESITWSTNSWLFDGFAFPVRVSPHKEAKRSVFKPLARLHRTHMISEKAPSESVTKRIDSTLFLLQTSLRLLLRVSESVRDAPSKETQSAIESNVVTQPALHVDLTHVVRCGQL